MVDAAYDVLKINHVDVEFFPPQLTTFRNTPYEPTDLLTIYLPSSLASFIQDLWTNEVTPRNPLFVLINHSSIF